MKIAIVLTAIAVSLLASFAGWHAVNRPVEIGPAWDGGVLRSVSFAPFRRGQSPLERRYPTTAQIDEDLAALKGRVAGVRTYASTEGLESVPRLAAQYGIEVTQGAWINPDRARNEVEIAALIDEANRHPQTVKRVIVGNEVLLRHEFTAEELAGYIRRVRQSVRQPVSYADVWEYWLRNPQLAHEVDYITVHFLPYWEDDPVGVDQAMEHIVAVYDRVRQAFPDKPILIGEVGWPSAGRSRERAVPSRAMQARFFNAFARLAHDRGMDYNLIEAFDQPWKTAHEGTVGGHWGLLDAERQPKFPPGGPVVEHPQWRLGFAGAAAAGALASLAMLALWPGAAAAFALAFLAQALAGMLAISAGSGLAQWYDKGVYFAPLLQFGLQAALALLLFAEALKRLAAPPSPVALNAPAAALVRLRAVPWRDRLLAVFVALALYETLWLALRPDLPALHDPLALLPGRWLYWIHTIFHGRYRDFPLPEFLVPTLGLALTLGILWISGRRPYVEASPSPRLDGAVAAMLIFGILLLQYVENFANREAIAWGGMALALALVPAGAVLRRSRARRIGQAAPSA